jgi:universal stress protein A
MGLGNKECDMKMNTAQEETVSAVADGDAAESRRARRLVLTLRQILVPLDFSGKSRQAFHFAVPLAERYGGMISLIHVVEPLYGYPPPGGTEGVVFPIRSAAVSSREKLGALARELVPPDLLGQTIVRTGSAYLEIVAAADELDADLIVMATHGCTGLKHALVGSTAERVVRHAHCPVLTVRRH